jgi:phosphinothricin acetyltransferase
MRIRLAVPADGPRLAEIYRPAVVDNTVSVELTAPTGAEMADRIAETLKIRPWIVAETDRVIGFAYSGPHRVRPGYAWSAEATIYIDMAAPRKGVGRALYTSLFAILTLQGYQNVYAGVILPNIASAGFHVAMGFTPVAEYRNVAFKHDQWLTSRWYHKALGSHPVPPAPTVPLPDLIGTPAFDRALASGTTLNDANSPIPSTGSAAL